MVEQSVLLQIIQFVGLITPALAILIELLVRFHGGLETLRADKELPIEVQILFIGFGAILVGGTVVGIQLVLTLSNQITQLAALFIFGGLPFLIISVLMMNIRISAISDPDTSIISQIPQILRKTSSISIPLLASSLLYLLPVRQFSTEINSNLNWWIFQGSIEPVWFFYVAGVIMLYKTMYSLWTHESIPSNNLDDVIGDWFVVSFTIGAFFLIFSGGIFVAYLLLLLVSVPYVTVGSTLSAIPYLWCLFVLLAVLITDIDPDND